VIIFGGMALLIGSTFLTIGKFERAQKQGDAQRRKAILNTVQQMNEATGTIGGRDDVLALGARIRAETKRLSALIRAKPAASRPSRTGLATAACTS
jgi:hypothetical protein